MNRRSFLKLLSGMAAAAVAASSVLKAAVSVPKSAPFRKLPLNTYITGTREIELHTRTVTPQYKKLKAVWSYEAEEDLRAYHNIEANTCGKHKQRNR